MEKKILYLFGFGRQERIANLSNYPGELFYGYTLLKEYYKNVEFIEAKSSRIRKFIQNNIEHKIGNVIKIPVLFSTFFSLKYFFKIKNSDILIHSTHRTFIATLPMLILLKLIGSTKTNIVFSMGMLREFPKNNILKKFKIKYIDKMFELSSKVYFLNNAELNLANDTFKKYKDKFNYYPFSADLNFWKIIDGSRKKNQVLFVGNDGLRDYNFLIKLVNNLNEINFVIVSKFINKNLITNKNCKIIQGSWDDTLLSDEELLFLYNESKLTILPLINSIQPSGQSVTLQSMASGTPVIITKTEGFWDSKNFLDNQNIFFLEENDILKWKEKILEVLNFDDNKYKTISQNSINLIKKKYSLEHLSNELIKFIN